MPDLIFIIIFAAVIIMIIVTLKQQRYHERGSDVDERNRMDYGEPVKSLYTSKPLITLHEHIDITDQDDRVLYTSDTAVVSLHDHTVVKDAEGKEVAEISRKIFSLHEVRDVQMADGTTFRLSNELLHLIRDVTNIEGLGWQLSGNILQMNYVIRDEKGKVLAVIGQKALSLHDKYSIDLYDTEHMDMIVTIVIALEHMITDRETAGNSTSGSANG
ncbi:MAG: LURP-one-related family protein [Solobacterium sp.]|jgi:uncharacterized protein YxjI|nr:LURP-one-related family protein [Solobacterium sp.]MCH4048239.1 LURP-one-related family protein [Solobacterium sp.]MCH4074907.1 LURP-one-related family protein [Solobacterium sp.]MCI1314017.1 LURP-one-related family protein [Solobacterium sp.]MCI1346090.1 LURP-one-related family protein [Solobacterium sp.]